MIVAGDLAAENGPPQVYAKTLDDFAAAWAWPARACARPSRHRPSNWTLTARPTSSADSGR